MAAEVLNTDPAIDQDVLVRIFVAEAGMHLATMEEAFLSFESHPPDTDAMRALLRSAHTLKGSASLVGLDGVGEVAHALEQVLERVRDGAGSRGCVPVLLETVDTLRRLTADAEAGKMEPSSGHQAVVARLLETALARPARSSAPASTPLDPAVRSQDRRRADRRTLRVDLARLDELLNLTGEILIARGRMARLIGDLPPAVGRPLLEADDEHETLYRQLQDLVLDVRMVPVGPLFRQYTRSVHDLAAGCGKEAELILDGEGVQVDASVVEQLRDPLTHLLRNAIDHGLETPAVRVARGKSPRGALTLSARQDGAAIVIALSDDGGGFNRRRILEVAHARGMAVLPESATDEEVFQLVFESGFSTAEQVTELSGRGVGMDVVRRNVQALRGILGIESREGAGSTITIRLPLTVAIIDGFSVGIRGETFVLPLDSVVECLELPAVERGGATATGLFSFRGQPLPYLRLGDWWGLGGAPSPRETLVIVRHGGSHIGLAVDLVIGESQTIIKSLGQMLTGTRGLSGSAILGTGRVALILDLPELLKEALSTNGQRLN